MPSIVEPPRSQSSPRSGSKTPFLGALCGFVLLFSTGCSRTPKAPVLRDEPVYQNLAAGFRFEVPDGWKQVAKGELVGDARQERLLVEYKVVASNQPAGLQVTAVDLPASTDLEKYLTGPSFGIESWQVKAPAETIQMQGAEGKRFAFEARPRKEETSREVVAIRRQGRVYFFTCVFKSDDTKARDQVRGAIKSLIWK
jgi:predicted Zn-dependent protease